MTPASLQALDGLRDLTTLEWYVIPLLAIVFYIYAVEINKARRTGNWNAVLAGLTIFGMDFINETWNGWVLVFTQRSACWTAPGETALRTMVGWNIEIMFMFAISGIAFGKMLLPDKKTKVLGIPNRLVLAVTGAAFCVFVEILLNSIGALTWEYPWWSAGAPWLIFLIGYLTFFLVAFFLAVFFFATFFLVVFFFAVFFFATFFRVTFFFVTFFFVAFFRAGAFLRLDAFFFATFFFDVAFRVVAFLRDAAAFLRVLLAAFFAGILYSCRGKKRPGLYIAGDRMEALFFWGNRPPIPLH